MSEPWILEVALAERWESREWSTWNRIAGLLAEKGYRPIERGEGVQQDLHTQRRGGGGYTPEKINPSDERPVLDALERLWARIAPPDENREAIKWE